MIYFLIFRATKLVLRKEYEELEQQRGRTQKHEQEHVLAKN